MRNVGAALHYPRPNRSPTLRILTDPKFMVIGLRTRPTLSLTVSGPHHPSRSFSRHPSFSPALTRSLYPASLFHPITFLWPNAPDIRDLFCSPPSTPLSRRAFPTPYPKRVGTLVRKTQPAHSTTFAYVYLYRQRGLKCSWTALGRPDQSAFGTSNCFFITRNLSWKCIRQNLILR